VLTLVSSLLTPVSSLLTPVVWGPPSFAPVAERISSATDHATCHLPTSTQWLERQPLPLHRWSCRTVSRFNQHTAPFPPAQCLPLSQDRWQVSADGDYAGACPSPSLGVDGEFRCCHRQHQQCPEMTSLPLMSNAWQVGFKSASQSAVPQVNTKSHLSVPFHRPPLPLPPPLQGAVAVTWLPP
jgi:hypothetical protein